MNATFLVLIPKFLGVDSMDHFKPISLCNYFYKIIYKLLDNKIIKILPLIIASLQSSFFLRRQILDSIITIHEIIIHSLKEGKREGFLLRLDLSKAYDWVD